MSPLSSRTGWVSFKVSLSCCLREFSLATVASGLFISNLNLHPDFWKAAFWQCLLLKVLYTENWIELNRGFFDYHLLSSSLILTLRQHNKCQGKTRCIFLCCFMALKRERKRAWDGNVLITGVNLLCSCSTTLYVLQHYNYKWIKRMT